MALATSSARVDAAKRLRMTPMCSLTVARERCSSSAICLDRYPRATSRRMSRCRRVRSWGRREVAMPTPRACVGLEGMPGLQFSYLPILT